jgi:hypothetical protein
MEYYNALNIQTRLIDRGRRRRPKAEVEEEK